MPIVQAGDLFHIKTPSKNSHKLVQQIHEIFKQVHAGVWVVPGNHDLSGNNLDSLHKQPLGALSRMDNVRILIGEDAYLKGIAGVPFIPQFDGGWWQGHLKDYYGDFDIDTPELLITHAPIFPPGKEPKVYASISAQDWADYWIGVPATYYGHIHECHGVFMDPNETMQFCNQGALSRGSLHEETINRKPAITLWTGTDFTRIEIPHCPPDQVFLLDKKVEKQAAKLSASEFAEAFENARLSVLTVESLRARLTEEVSDQKVLGMLLAALED